MALANYEKEKNFFLVTSLQMSTFCKFQYFSSLGPARVSFDQIFKLDLRYV